VSSKSGGRSTPRTARAYRRQRREYEPSYSRLPFWKSSKPISPRQTPAGSFPPRATRMFPAIHPPVAKCSQRSSSARDADTCVFMNFVTHSRRGVSRTAWTSRRCPPCSVTKASRPPWISEILTQFN
jgi:hypothetical protein